MGLFDSIEFMNPDPRFVCSEGHSPRSGWQTKDLGCNMTGYTVLDGKLFVYGDSERRERKEVTPTGGILIVTERELLPADTITGWASMYQSCRLCKPVLTVTTTADPYPGDRVQESRPWIEFEASIVRGQIEEVKAVKVETRDEVRKKLIARGLEVLDDNERLALRHFELRARRGGGDD